MKKCVIDFQHRSDLEYAIKLAQSMEVKPWDVIAKTCWRPGALYTLVVYFQDKAQVRAFLEFLVSDHNVKLSDITIRQRRKWKESRK